MKLVSKKTVDLFNNETYSMGSMFEIFGSQPHHIAGYVRLKNQHKLGLLQLVEGLGNVYEKNVSPRMKEIQSLQFTWDVEVSQVPTVRFTRNAVAPANPNDPFTVYMEQSFFNKYDVLVLENQQLLYVQTEAEKVNDWENKYTVVYFADLGAPDVNFIRQNSTARYVYNMHGEFSEYGTTKTWYNMERHINYMTKLRSGQAYSQDFRAIEDLFFVSNNDATKLKEQKDKGSKSAEGVKIFKLSSIEQQVLDNFYTSSMGALMTGRTTIDSTTGRAKIGIDGQEVIAGDGLIPQYERYAQYIDYVGNQLRLKDFQDAIETVCDRRGKSMGNHITVVCNRKFSRDKAAAFQNALLTFVPANNGTWFFSRDLKVPNDPMGGNKLKKEDFVNDVTLGATFNTYIYEGNTITFVVDEFLTNHYPDQGYALFIDSGAYETENGSVPGVHMTTLKGRQLVKGYTVGMGGIDGTSSGMISNPSDASRFDVLGWRGICVMNPYAATIMQEVK
jgi:hypothetical protein